MAVEHAISDSIIAGLDAWTRLRDSMVESIFFNVYGSPLLQSLVGLRADRSVSSRGIGRDLGREMAASRFSAELEKQIDQGGLVEAVVRALIYVGHKEGRVDERAFTVLQDIRESMPPPSASGWRESRKSCATSF